MSISYKPLWHLLVEHGNNKSDLTQIIGASSATIAKMGKNQYVSLEVIDKLCNHYNVQPNKIIEHIPNMNQKETTMLIKFLDNTPTAGEAYAIITDGKRYAFTWGPKYPYIQDINDIPKINITDGTSGLEWFDSEKTAKTALQEALEANHISD